MKQHWGVIALGKVTRKRVREVISLTTIKKMVIPTKNLIDTESYIMATSDMEGVYG